MALQNYIDKIGPVVSAAWLNAVDLLKETIFENSTTKAQARIALTNDAPLEVYNGGTGNRLGTPLIATGGGIAYAGGTVIANGENWLDEHTVSCVGSTVIQFMKDCAAEETSLLIRHNAGGGGVALERVTVGIADSGGVGYRVLRIPN